MGREKPEAYQQFGFEMLQAYHLVIRKSDSELVWRHLERAHILSQSSAWRHTCIHFVMFGYALSRTDVREAIGQIPRLMLAAIGSLLGRAPRGNTGRSNIGMFVALPLPENLERIINEKS